MSRVLAGRYSNTKPSSSQKSRRDGIPIRVDRDPCAAISSKGHLGKRRDEPAVAPVVERRDEPALMSSCIARNVFASNSGSSTSGGSLPTCPNAWARLEPPRRFLPFPRSMKPIELSPGCLKSGSSLSSHLAREHNLKQQVRPEILRSSHRRSLPWISCPRPRPLQCRARP